MAEELSSEQVSFRFRREVTSVSHGVAKNAMETSRAYDSSTRRSMFQELVPNNVDGFMAEFVVAQLEEHGSLYLFTPDQAKWFALGALAQANGMTGLREAVGSQALFEDPIDTEKS